jgi:hypothetical protein
VQPNNKGSETHAAVMADVPINYDDNALHLSLWPKIRYGGASGYSAITSNYYHLDASAQVQSERGSVSLTGSFYRDSSLLYAGELSNGVGVRRDMSSGDLNSQYLLTERLQLQFEASSSRTLFGQGLGGSGLTDYRFSSIAPALGYSLNERDTVRLISNLSRYKSLDGFTKSDSLNLQLGYDHAITEIWKLTTTAGYSKSNNTYHYFFGDLETSQKGSVYAASVRRDSQKLVLTMGLSRSLSPTGAAFLSRQDMAQAYLGYSRSERWSYSAGVNWNRITDPVIGGGTTTRKYYYGDLTATYHWTENWLITGHITKLSQQYTLAGANVSPTSNGVRLEIMRQFYRTNH